MRIAIASIVFDAGTQIRAAINKDVVAQYAEAMTDGAQFPPVVLFHDGNRYYMADGFHRALASKRIDARDIVADVHPGTQLDATWFAMGANRVHGHRLTYADKRYAVALALKTWPDKSATQIAAQLGVSQSFVSRQKDQVMPSLPARVTGKDGKIYPASRPLDRQREEAAALIKAGKTVDEVRQAVGVSRETVAEVRKSLGLGGLDRSQDAVDQRRARMRTMAAEGYSSSQIAAAVGMSEDRCRSTMRESGIDVPADRVTSRTKRHDANRIAEQMVLDAENLTADVNLIDFSILDRERIPDWLGSLKESREKLGAFIRLLMKEQQKHGEAA